MKKERQDILKDIWETVVSDGTITQTIEKRKVRGINKVWLNFYFGGEYILKKTIFNGKESYFVFKPIGLRQNQIEELLFQIKANLGVIAV